MTATLPAPLLTRAIEVADYVRFRSWGGEAGAPQREWFHFVVRAPDADVIVNLSLVERPPRGGAAVGNCLLLVRARDDGRWDGDLDEHPLGRADVGAGRIRLRLGACALDFDGAFRVRARCRRRPLAVDLALAPRCFPCVVPNVALGDGAAIHWAVTPRLAATGTVRWGERVLRVDGAPAYHDHNWGTFRGADLAWEWGCALAGDGDDAPSVVFVRVLDSRGASLAQSLLVWEGAHRRRVFRGREVAFSPDGWLRPARALRVPRALSLLAPGAATDVPARLGIRATSGADHVEGEVTSEDAARVLVPRDTDLGTTVIHEVTGRLRLAGTLGGRPFEASAPAFFEVLGALR